MKIGILRWTYNGHDDKNFKDSDCEESKDSDNVKPNDITGAKAYIETPGSRKLKGSSLYYGALYNHFCDLGGLRSIILILSQDKDDEKRVSLNIVSDLVAIVCAPGKLYRNERQKTVLMEFREKLENRLENVSKHELQNLDEKCVNEILDTSEQLFLRIYDDFSGDKRRELYNLNLMKRILSCSILNKRIEAIDNILICIKQTEARERRAGIPQLLPYIRRLLTIITGMHHIHVKWRGGHNRQREYHANDQNINIKWLTPKEIGRLDNGKKSTGYNFVWIAREWHCIACCNR